MKPVNVVLDELSLAYLEVIATATGASRSEILRRAIVHYAKSPGVVPNVVAIREQMADVEARARAVLESKPGPAKKKVKSPRKK